MTMTIGDIAVVLETMYVYDTKSKTATSVVCRKKNSKENRRIGNVKDDYNDPRIGMDSD